ncbi:response regulator [Rhodanobacter sp. Col0626]|uniref:response regulator n=1 Tax=Rhodanobacter sp. Col0626 TaxID=3415679 RepID=UPI003CF5C1E9
MKNEGESSQVVLVVEDELMIATTLEMILSEKGYQVAGPVSTVEDALALLETARPDVALLDYRLGGSTTEPLLSVLQERGIPVCMLTGYGRDALPERYQQYSVLEKPFSLNELLEEVQRLCG